ncbi:hypothetical protein [Yersinia pekkanenii]|uniref:Uncharacterized protein n=1 Tax=Yersinia pekkanenii TaxID=1288385 RepID=A0A0T9RKE3_9GAMM|nr:hypothetical protein [Yersinia pekkanenii]CNI68193.1 Uncharacterised protein [Yersinia pekkanenii]CRY69750.1 Uncharacterised protein [Yersinia pekkanenii]
MSENTDYETLIAERNAALAQVWRLVGENVVMQQIIDSVTDLDNEPKYHSEGMGCGLEDRGITDRYDAMQHGWECAMERVYGEVIPCAEELDFSATTQVLNEYITRSIVAPDGYQLCFVPLEQTTAFRDACTTAYEESLSGTGPCGVFMAAYRSMLSAAPKITASLRGEHEIKS